MFFVWSQKRINVKLAWWGPTGSGKTTSIHALAARLEQSDRPESGRSSLGLDRNAQPVEVDEPDVCFTTYFCHPPAELGEFGGYPVHYQCKTPEQPWEQNQGLERVLDGISGVVLVCDAARRRQSANEEALADLVARLAARFDVAAGSRSAKVSQLFGEQGPLRLALQVNRCDVDDAIGSEQVRRALMLPDDIPVVETVATRGEGVWEAFEAMAHSLRPLLERAQERGRIPSS